MFSPSHRYGACATVAVAAFVPSLFVLPAARADTTVVYEVTVKGVPEGVTANGASSGAAARSTTYYKNNKSRTESDDIVILYDGDTKIITTLNPKTKTYTASTETESAAARNAAMNPLLGQIKFSVKTFVRPGGQTRTIAGRKTKNTKFTAIMKMGVATADAPPGMAQMLPTITLSGEEWMAGGVVSEAQKRGMATTAFGNMAQMNPMMGAGLKEFASKISAIEGFPLASTLSTTIAFPDGAAAAMGASVPKQPIVITMQAKSVSMDPLDDALFTVPEGYIKAEPAAPTPDAAPTKVL